MADNETIMQQEKKVDPSCLREIAQKFNAEQEAKRKFELAVRVMAEVPKVEELMLKNARMGGYICSHYNNDVDLLNGLRAHFISKGYKAYTQSSNTGPFLRIEW